ncbi:MAG: ACT domain-containing protein [Limnochordia bacterium]
MSEILTLPEVQHWGVCRSVELKAGTVLTDAARDWLAEQGIEVTFAEATMPEAPVISSPQPEGISSLLCLGYKGAASRPQTPATDCTEVQRAVITVLGRDRVGIIAAIASTLASHGVNVLDISQTLFGDLFSMTMVVNIAGADVSFHELRAALDDVGSEMHLKVVIQLDTVFDFMHRV